MPANLLIAIGYHDSHGKDTFTTFCIDHLRAAGPKGLCIEVEPFAKKLYEICQLLYGWGGFKSRAYYDKNRHEKEEILPLIGYSPRAILLDVGAKMREYDPQCFLNPVIQPGEYDVKFCPDLRACNEGKGVLRKRGLCVELFAPSVPLSPRMVDEAIVDFPFTHRLLNDGTRSDLNAKAKVFVHEEILPRLAKGGS